MLDELEGFILFDVVWIRDNEVLANYCKQWLELPFVTLDTEFLRETTFYPIAGLIQLYDGQMSYLIDPLIISQWLPFKTLLEETQVVKVLHACSEDLELLYQLTGAIVAPVFDTQLAAAFLSMGIMLGYSPLVKQILNIEINKEEKRSDWLQRPLSSEQEQYAVSDVVHLADLYQYFLKQLSVDKLSWLYEDTNELSISFSHSPDPQSLYLEAKQGWRLYPEQLVVLKALYEWREQKSRSHNIARGRLLKDSSIFEMAKERPRTLEALAKIEGIHPRIIRKEGELILKVIANAVKIPKEIWPNRLAKPLPKNCSKLNKALKAMVIIKAKELGLCPELLWRKKIIEKLLRSGCQYGRYQLPDNLQGWRRQLLGESLLATLNRENNACE